jgi:hypothetical protein
MIARAQRRQGERRRWRMRVPTATPDADTPQS